jgi:V8-like Glu-specific endopeptidase
MLKSILFSLILLSTYACGNKSQHDLLIVESAIFGGEKIKADSKFLPFIVGVFDKNHDYICTGTLITKNTVLTAAHCVIKAQNNEMQIVLDEKIRSKRKIIVNDVALIRFTDELPSDKSFTNIDNAIELENEFISDVNIAGMGHSILKPFKMGAGTLRESVLKNQKINLLGDIIVLDQSKETGVCQGDSGSGIFVERDGKIVLLGVTSAVDVKENKKVADCNRNAYFSSLKYFHQWISQNI